MDTQEFKDAAKASIDHIVDYYENITDHSVVSQVEPGYLRKVLPDAAPEEGEPWDVIRQDIDAKIVPGLTHWQSPNFFAFFPCPSSYPSLLGELYSAAFTGACFNWVCSPAVTELETIVLDWLARALGLPPTYRSTGPTRGGGVIQGTASESVLTMMVAARDKYLRETLPAAGEVGEEELDDLTMRKRSRMVALASSACHSSTKKAAKILGVRYAAIPVTSATNYALTGPALAETLATCRAKGWEPFFLTATLGTTDTCAALDEFTSGFAPVANGDGATEGGAPTDADDEVPPRKKGEVWVHIDAAYAGAALVTPEAQSAVGVHHLRRFHSFNTNMHKWLLTNFDASCLFVADRRWLEEAMSAELHVYRNTYSDGGFVTDYRNWQIPLGRRFRSLKIWFVMRNYGVRGLQEYIRRGVKLGELFAGLVEGRRDLFEVLTGPVFALTVFRMAPEAETEERRNELTKKLYEEVNKTGKIWVTGTVLEGKFAIRVMTGNRLTEEGHVRGAFELIQATAERIMNEK
ncbi:Tyrosine decarboxylase 1 [Cytospora mali]|uniref:Tyrosine decarboxylase 1 n=1 Tax=Cytospora mali TaxID=578113 RepID=A0A194UZ28_CYTMA|nr:Tyrosine decarboxylase 1 [Valsa mali var. pyri (nom. inval.)]